eukprot:TRINITY_DN1332_c0_g1_i7.p1 TRINITY_DN1332_c0_g1~~TRINITY_DN1332_c0_g1_i7.p1  ORF type:complete len:438 (+),score=104.32 TRINITY_DN1332_c0_g1_i7:565-1878(+)
MSSPALISAVPRDPANNCEFKSCPVEEEAVQPDLVEHHPVPVMCSTDVLTCPDGVTVPRDFTNNCEFKPCPAKEGVEQVLCTTDVFTCPDGCPDGNTVPRDPRNNCAFVPCPLKEEPVCTTDVFTCPDGSSVPRDPSNNCEFKPCPVQQDAQEEEKLCTTDVFTCPDGKSVVSRDPSNNCEFKPCPIVEEQEKEVEEEEAAVADQVLCTTDVFTCPDGSAVPRDPSNDCNFKPCPPQEEAALMGAPFQGIPLTTASSGPALSRRSTKKWQNPNKCCAPLMSLSALMGELSQGILPTTVPFLSAPCRERILKKQSCRAKYNRCVRRWSACRQSCRKKRKWHMLNKKRKCLHNQHTREQSKKVFQRLDTKNRNNPVRRMNKGALRSNKIGQRCLMLNNSRSRKRKGVRKYNRNLNIKNKNNNKTRKYHSRRMKRRRFQR